MTELNDLLSEMRAHGIDWDNPVADGSVHRFGKKKKQWAIVFQNHTTKGEVYIVAQYGDWSMGQTHTYKTSRQYNRAEEEHIKKQITKAQAHQRKEKKQRQEKAASEAQNIWKNAGNHFASPYFEKKGIDNLYGSKTAMDSSGRIIIVPVRDIESNLVGAQIIYQDGVKRFLEGQKVTGCFHQIGEVGERVYVCEGFATAVSIHKATKEAVFCAFYASNLSHVCRALKGKYPNSNFIVVADDDHWTVNGKSEPYNPGLEAAQEAARICFGEFISPTFKDVSSKPTDFNDLELLEGLDEVKKQTSIIVEEKVFVICLGYSNDYYYYTSSDNKQIVRLSFAQHTESGLMNLMPLEYWETLYPGYKGGIDVKVACNELMKSCRKKGVFDDSLVRGIGVWPDCINLGDTLWINGARNSLRSNKDNFIYTIGKRLPAPDTRPADDAECLLLQETLSAVSWANPQSAELFGGWLVLAPVCGALAWRPHIWLTGASGVGKSFLMYNLVSKTLPFRNECQGASTEAGIRQSTGCDAVPLIFDEFETDDDKSSDRIKTLLELFRQASSETDGKIFKGTSGGKHISFMPRFSVLVSSIRVNLVNEADRTRFTVCEIKRSNDVNQFANFQKLLAQIPKNFGNKLFARTYKNIDVLRANIELLSRLIGDKYNQRFGQQYGAIFAGYSLLNTTKKLDKKTAMAMVAGADLSDFTDTINDTDEIECEDHLLNSLIRVETAGGFRDYKISSIITEALDDSVVSAKWFFVKALADRGILIDGGHIFISQKNPELAKIFKNTKWVAGWSKSLSRIKGAENSIQKKIDKRNVRCTKIPLVHIMK